MTWYLTSKCLLSLRQLLGHTDDLFYKTDSKCSYLLSFQLGTHKFPTYLHVFSQTLLALQISPSLKSYVTVSTYSHLLVLSIISHSFNTFILLSPLQLSWHISKHPISFLHPSPPHESLPVLADLDTMSFPQSTRFT